MAYEPLFAGVVVEQLLDRHEKHAPAVIHPSALRCALVPCEDIEQLLAGYSADVEIILDVRKDTLRIPTEALMDGDSVYVLSADAGLVERRQVRTGTANWDHTEVIEGLEEGELVVTSVDREGLADGVAAHQEAAPAQ